MAAPQHPLRVVITGASSGLGAALARCYARSGAILGLVARRDDRLAQLAASLPLPCERYAVDVRNAGALSEAARHFMDRHGAPGIVIANAGVSVGTLTDFPEDTQAFQDVMDINLTGMVNTFQPFLAAMREAGEGTLAGIASVAGHRGLPGAGAYCASKAAVIAYLESLRVELRGSGIRVVTVSPGFVDTPMTAKNPYPMPFRISAEQAADKTVSLIARGSSYAVIPWQMAVIARVLRVMPNWLYDRLLTGRPHKPRRSQ
jgi:short-subunit dehydrogenase